MRKTAPKMPDNVESFLKETKVRLYTHDADSWSVELTELYDLSVTHNLGLHTPDPRTQTYAELSATNEWEERIVQTSVPTLQLVEASGDEFRLPPERQRHAWIIDANAPRGGYP